MPSSTPTGVVDFLILAVTFFVQLLSKTRNRSSVHTYDDLTMVRHLVHPDGDPSWSKLLIVCVLFHYLPRIWTRRRRVVDEYCYRQCQCCGDSLSIIHLAEPNKIGESNCQVVWLKERKNSHVGHHCQSSSRWFRQTSDRNDVTTHYRNLINNSTVKARSRNASLQHLLEEVV